MRKIALLLSVSFLVLGAHGSQAADCSHSVGSPSDPTGQLVVCYGVNQTGSAMIAPQASVTHCYGRNHCDTLAGVDLPQTGASITTFPVITLGQKQIQIPNVCTQTHGCTPNTLPYPVIDGDTGNLLGLSLLGMPFDVSGLIALCISTGGNCNGPGVGINNFVKVRH
ncbi:MAG: hypothetical protein ACYDCC_09260 [Actinomycetota bacterium]